MKIKTLRRRSQAGLTLVEVLLVLAIAAVAIVGGTVLFSAASETQKTNQTLSDLNALSAGVRTLFNTQPDYGAVATDLVPLLANAGKIPANMRTATNTITDQFGGNVTVVSQGGSFDVTMPGVPQAPCVTILNTLGSTTGGANIVSIETGDANYGTDAFPIDIVEANAACTDTNTNTITIEFR